MPNPYAAAFRDDNGETRLAGELDFIEPSNQPGGALDGVLAYMAANHTVSSGSTIPWDTTVYDSGGYLNPATGKFAIPASKLGVWRVDAMLTGVIDTTIDQMLAFFDGPLTDNWYLNLPGNSGLAYATAGVFVVNVPSADVWDMTIYGGGSPSVYGGLQGSRVALTYLGPKP